MHEIYKNLNAAECKLWCSCSSDGVQSTYFHAQIDCDIYVCQPRLWSKKWERQTYGLKLDKSLYGLRKLEQLEQFVM